MYKSQEHFISELEKAGELIRIKEFVNPHLEIAEVVDRISKSNHNKALLFENTGTGFPLLINAMGSEKRMCMVLGVEKLDDVAKDIETLFHSLTSPKNSLSDKLKMLPELGKISSWMPKKINGRGECQDIVISPSLLGRVGVGLFPVMKCWPHDGGNFLTLPIIHTVDPNNGIRNVGLYRMQVFGPKLTAMHWHKHKVSAGHFNEYKKLGKKMPVAVALGGDPLYVFSAACPLPPNFDEYMFTGFLRKKKVELVKCLTQEMYVPADADIIIEGYVDPVGHESKSHGVDPNEEFILEGPFGDHTGYYSLADYYPKFHITCITHKKNAIYPSTIVGIPPQEDAWMGKAIERIFLAPIKMTILPEIIDMHMPVEGVFHNLVIVKIKNEYEGHAQKVMNAMWGAGQMMFNKILVIVDGKTNIHNYEEVARAISDNVDIANDIYFSQGPMDVLDHACSKFAFGGKMCLDATASPQPSPKERENKFPLLALKLFATDIQKTFSEIKGINSSLLEKEISVLFISVEKNRKNHIKELNEKIFSLLTSLGEGVGMGSGLFVIYVEDKADITDIKDCIWRFANNFDPKRDSFPSPAGEGLGVRSGIGLDGTRKSKQHDNFDRPWPNIICSDEKTIKSVDEKWSKMFGSLSFISSPSLKYRNQLYKGAAVAEE
ncbi:MAG: menaquinone biosynthesis decarboxylase [Bacteroidetes bacterium]|nr:menaquinone biosynthesis decarboxylase [Bacteroidota bacterium]